MAPAGADCLRKTFPAMRAGTLAAQPNQVAPPFFFHTPGTAVAASAFVRPAPRCVRAANE